MALLVWIDQKATRSGKVTGYGMPARVHYSLGFSDVDWSTMRQRKPARAFSSRKGTWA